MSEGVGGALFRRTLEGYAGKIDVTLFPGSIPEAVNSFEFDALVSGDDTRLAADWDVPRLIRRMAGPSVEEEAARLAPLAVGDVGVTNAGNLPARYVFHVVTADLEHGVWAGRKTLRHIARGLFIRCEALGVRHLLVAALADGVAGISPEDVAFTLIDVLHRHAHNATSLETVVIVLPDEAAFHQFSHELARPRPAPGSIESARESRAPLALRVHIEYDVSVPSAVGPNEATTRPGSGPPPDKAAQQRGAGKPLEERLDSRPLLGGRYVLLEELGRGGFGIVYLSWDLVLRRVVAIKRLREEFAGWDLLRREAAIAMELNHEGIVRTHHFEPRADQGGPYLVMEYSPWPTGERWAAEAGQSLIPTRPVVELGIRACDALAYAHDQGVLHLDIKPGNLFVDPAGERTKLADFGVARLLSAERRALQMVPMGTPAYMAPEQRRGGQRLEPATDVYQLGATLWDLLTGGPPPHHRGKFRTHEPERASALDVIGGALDDDPRLRPRSARAFGEQLARVLAT